MIVDDVYIQIVFLNICNFGKVKIALCLKISTEVTNKKCNLRRTSGAETTRAKSDYCENR